MQFREWSNREQKGAYHENLKENYWELNKVKNNWSKFFALLLLSLSDESLDEVKRSNKFERIDQETDQESLWQINEETHKVKTISEVQSVTKKAAIAAYQQMRQSACESIITYKERFNAMLKGWIFLGNYEQFYLKGHQATKEFKWDVSTHQSANIPSLSKVEDWYLAMYVPNKCLMVLLPCGDMEFVRRDGMYIADWDEYKNTTVMRKEKQVQDTYEVPWTCVMNQVKNGIGAYEAYLGIKLKKKKGKAVMEGLVMKDWVARE